jgi:site-specific recombinase XerD
LTLRRKGQGYRTVIRINCATPVGHLLADAGHDTRRLQLWLGHSDIKHTARYSELSAKPFKDFWR